MMVHTHIDSLMTENNPDVAVVPDAAAVTQDVTITDAGTDAVATTKTSALIASSSSIPPENSDNQMALDQSPVGDAGDADPVVDSSIDMQSPAVEDLPPPPPGHSRRVAASGVVPKQTFKPYPNAAQRSTSRSLSPSPLPSPSPSLEEEPVRTGVDPRATYMNRVEGQKNRFLFSDHHNQVLEAAFQINHSAVSVKVELAQRIGCTELQIVNWFSRRRQREKERLSESGAPNVVSKKLEILEKTSIRSSSVPTGGPEEKRVEAVASKGISDEKRMETAAKRTTGSLGQKPSSVEPKPREERPSPTAGDAPRPVRHEKPNGEIITGTLGGSEIQKRVSQLVQGGTIIGPEQVKLFISLMNAARDNEGRRSPLNALLMTVRSRSSKAAEISKRFVKENGGLALRKWIEAGREDFTLPGNKNMLMNTIEIAKALPFDFEALKECKLGVTVKQLAKDDEAQQDIRNSALALEKQWRQLVSSTFDISKLSEKATRDNGGKRAENKRDAPFEAVDMPLPKFVKGKSSGPVEITKKPQIRENAAFFKDIGLSLRTNTSSANSPSSPSQTVSSPTIPVPASVTATAPQAPALTLPSSPSQESPSGVVVPASASDLVSSILANAAVLKMIASKASAITEVESPTPVAAPVAVPTKPKKTVRFKNADELVSIRFIDPRPLPGEEEEESEDEDLAFARGADDDDAAMSYMGRGGSTINPVFMITDTRKVLMVRGDHWTTPLEISVDEDHQVNRGERSTEKEAQEKRELETLSANYFQLAYIPPSPAEPDLDPVPLDPTSVKPIVLNDGTEVLLGSLKLLEQFASNAAPTAAYNPYEGYGQAYGTQYADASQQQQYSPTAAVGSYPSLYAAAGAGYAPQAQQEQSYVVPSQQTEPTAAAASATAAFPDAQTTLALLQMLQQHTQQPQPQQPAQSYQQQYQQAYQQPQQQQATYGQNATYPYYYQNNQPPSSS